MLNDGDGNIPKTILVVDDEPDIIYSIEVGITKLTTKYDIIGVNSGRECIELLKQGNKPDIIILDIMMPNMNGFQVLDVLKTNREWKDIPVIFLTALDDSETMEKGIETNSYCIRKPFRIEELKATIDKVLEGETFF